MGWLWPGALFLLGLIPLIVALYIWVLRRRKRYAVRFSSLALVRLALPQQSRWRRHLPFALFVLALTALIIALARPVAVVQVPAGQTTVILALDVSKSMCSTDIAPNRLEAAKDAALAFIERQQSGTRIGIVAFAGFSALVQPPTGDQAALHDAIESLTTGYRTAIGSAILESVDAIAEVNPGIASVEEGFEPGTQTTPVPEGAYAPDIIVVLSDGASNAGPMPLDAAQQAADRGIRVFTIGFGTPDGSNMDCGDGLGGMFGFGGGGGGGGGFGGGWFRRGIDEPTLREVASMTGGDYYSATSADELQQVFQDLPTYLITREQKDELSVLFTAAGALLAALAIGLSLWWNTLT